MNKNLLTRVIIISDDLYYLQGLSAKLGNHYRFFIECFFCSQNACNNDLSTLRFDNRFTKNVLLVAVDDVSILAKLPDLARFLMIVSLRKMKNRNIFFSLSEQTFISRYIKLNKLITLIKSTDKDQQVRQVTLTRYEWDIYYLYFKIDNKRILHTLLKKDVKYISHYKISVFNKFEFACDSDGFYIFKALIQLRRFTGFKNVRLYQLH
ncbi:hypothetical protein [Escherichia coli]|uniref:hypothetical protein n=1 Tax=Escherichia coli TaxID=562 RepID=UPI001FF4B107|nr:hypothetical protein [Escherichia coli]MCJ8493064.1 hypothetical protein [Escherichia coli]